MRASFFAVLAFASTCAVASEALCNDIPVFSSGVDANHHVLAEGQADPHYSLIAVPANYSLAVPAPATVATPHPVYVPNDAVGSAGSSWIAGGADTTWPTLPGTFTYRTTFDLTGLDPTTAHLTGSFAVDDTVTDILLNGVSLGISGGQFVAFSPAFHIDAGFQSGVNTLDFVTENLGDSTSPAGFRVQISGTADSSVVVDTTAPVFQSLTVSPSVITQRNHRTTKLTVTAVVTDNTDPAPTVKILSITSNESGCGHGSDDDDDDNGAKITGDLTAEVRAERDGRGSGRVYTITVEATDAAGNTSTATVTVTVAHDNRKH